MSKVYYTKTRKDFDVLTGDEIEVDIPRRELNKDDPYNSPEFHNIADLLGLDAIDRVNPHMAKELVILYNWGMDKSKTDDPQKVLSFLNDYRRSLNVGLMGPDLVKYMYRNVRLFESKKPQEKSSPQKEETSEGDSKQAKELRSSGDMTFERWKESVLKSQTLAKKSSLERGKMEPKYINEKIRIVEPQTGSEEIAL